MEVPRNTLTIEQRSFYYDALVNSASKLDIWETEYFHVMDSADAIVEWIASTGLRPFLAALDEEDQREDFVGELRHHVREFYETRADGNVLYPFRRTFVVAYR